MVGLSSKLEEAELLELIKQQNSNILSNVISEIKDWPTRNQEVCYVYSQNVK